MARKKQEEVQEVESTESKDSVTVTWKGNSRTYSKEIHGDDFKTLAKEFSKKISGELA